MRGHTRVRVHRWALSSVTALVAVLALVGTTGLPASAATSPTGTLQVQLVTPSGAPIRVAFIQLVATDQYGNQADASSNSSGTVTFPNEDPARTYAVSSGVFADAGANSYAPAQHVPVSIAAGSTTVENLTLDLGATVNGNIVGPGGTVQSGKLLFIQRDGSTADPIEAISDSLGHYAFEGLGTGIYTIEAYSNGEIGSPATWKTQVVEQNASRAASHITLSTHYLHSAYDLVMDVTSSTMTPTAALSGATVIAHSTTTSASYTERLSTVLDYRQSTQFFLPTGNYVIELRTAATPGTPSRSLWFDSDSDDGVVFRGPFVADRSDATPVPVTYGDARSGYSTNLSTTLSELSTP